MTSIVLHLLKMGDPATFTTYDFELGMKVTASMTSFARAELKIRIKDFGIEKENIYSLLQIKWKALIDI
jgi:hypothetical protein